MRVLFFLCSLLSIFQAHSVELKNGIVTFESSSQALPYVFEAQWNYIARPMALSSYKKIEDTIELIYAPLCKKFSNCSEFQKPILMLSNNGKTGSFGLFFDQQQRQSNILIISEELAFNQKHLEFVVAHELVHYFSRHAETDTQELEISDIYKFSEGEVVRYNYPYEEVKLDFLTLIEAMDDLGPRAHLISSSHKLSVAGKMGRLTDAMIREVMQYGDRCLRLSIQFKRIKSIQNSGSFLSASRPEVLNFLKDASACFEKYPGDLFSSIAYGDEFFGNEEKKIRDVVEQETNQLKKLQALHSLIMKRYTSLSQKLGGPQIRFENEEDAADTMAIELLKELGRTGMRQYTDYLLTDSSPRDQLKCFSELNSNREPYYGILTNPHHEECWRIWRAQKLEREIVNATSAP